MKKTLFSIILLVGCSVAHAGAVPAISAIKTNSLSVDVNGNGRANPGDTLKHTVIITAPSGGTNVQFTDPLDPHTTFVPGSLHVSPIAFDDAYTAVGNTKLYVGTTPPVGEPALVSGSPGLLANDTIATDTITFSGLSGTTTQGGSVVVNADGTFTYTPPVGFTGADTFNYTLANSADGTLTGSGTVTITVSSKVWYVDNTAAGGGNGTSASAFNSLSAVSGATGPDAAGDIIYIATGAGNYTGGIALLPNQVLWGQNEALIVGTNLLKSAGTDPVIVNAGGNGVTLTNGNLLKGFTIGSTTTGGIVGTTVGSLTVSNVVLNGPGPLFTIGTSGALNVTLDSATTTSSGTTGISLTGVTGSFTVVAGAISGVTGDDFVVNGGTANISFPGPMTNAAGHSVNIQNKTAGTVAFSGNITDTGTGILVQNNTGSTLTFSGATKSLNTGANAAVTLAGNTASTIDFTGGGLAITTTSGAGLTATGGGTISVQGAVNTIDATNGVALNVANTTISTNGLTFRHISSGAGANDGISLDTTGASGSLTITGTGSANSGGVISGKTGADNNTAQGIGIFLKNVLNVSLSFMDIEGCQNYGIRGFTVGGFALTNSTVGTSAANGTSNTADQDAGTLFSGEGSIRFNDLTGTGSIINCTLDGGLSRTAAFHNTSGSLNLMISGCTVRDTSVNAQTSDALFLQSSSTATMNLTVTSSCQFTAYRQNAIQTDARDTSTMSINIDNCTFANSNPTLINAGGSLSLGSSASTDTLVQFNIHNNSFRHGAVGSGSAPNNGGAHLVCGTITGAGKFDGKFVNNTVGVTGIAFSGSGNAADGLRVFTSGNKAGTTRVTGTTDSRFLIQSNVIKNYGEVGIQLNCRQGNATLDATVFGNTINEPGSAAQGAFGAIWANVGALGGDLNIMNIAIGDAVVGANKNTMQDSDPNNATDVFLENDSAAGASFNLYKNGSGSGTTTAVITDDNNPTLDLSGFTSGTITLQSGAPSSPP